MYYTCVTHEKEKQRPLGHIAHLNNRLLYHSMSFFFNNFPIYFYVTLRTPLTDGVLV